MSEQFYDPEKNYLGAGRNRIPGDVSFDEWMEFGIRVGFCGPPVCYTHDGIPTTEEEDATWAEGNDPCMHIVRMYEDADMKKKILDNHSPSNWRDSWTH